MLHKQKSSYPIKAVSVVLQKLYVCNNGLSAEAVGELATLLIANTNCNLSLLHFYNNMSGTVGAINFSKILDHFTDIEDLRFSATRAGAEGCLELAKVRLLYLNIVYIC